MLIAITKQFMAAQWKPVYALLLNAVLLLLLYSIFIVLYESELNPRKQCEYSANTRMPVEPINKQNGSNSANSLIRLIMPLSAMICSKKKKPIKTHIYENIADRILIVKTITTSAIIHNTKKLNLTTMSV